MLALTPIRAAVLSGVQQPRPSLRLPFSDLRDSTTADGRAATWWNLFRGGVAEPDVFIDAATGALTYGAHNLVCHSNTVGATGWTRLNANVPSASTTVSDAPPGFTTSQEIAVDGSVAPGNAPGYFANAGLRFVTPGRYIVSGWFKLVSGTLILDLFVGNQSGAVTPTGAWQRLSAVVVNTSGDTPAIYARNNQIGVLRVAGLQIQRAETGTEPGEYVLTTGAPVWSLNPRITFSRGSLATRINSAGNVEYGPHNLFLNSETAATQTITGLTSGASYVISGWGTGSIALSGGGSGTLTGIGAGPTPGNRVSLTFTASSSSVTFMVTGSVTQAQLNIGPLQPYYPTTSAAYFGPRFTHNPVTLQPLGFLPEEQKTNELLNSRIDGTNLVTQNVTVTAAARTLHFTGTGTVTLSGAFSGTLVGTGAGEANRVSLSFTPSAGTLTVTVSGDVKLAQLELGGRTSFIPTAGATVTRLADDDTFALSAVTTGSEGTVVIEHRAPSGTPLLGDGGTALLSSTGPGKSAISWHASGTTIVHNGGTPTTSGPISVGATLRLMRTASAFANATNSRTTGYPRALPAATLQRLTA